MWICGYKWGSKNRQKHHNIPWCYSRTKIGGKNEGVATIGDNCVLGPGCKILGKCTIGDNVFVGANAVVTHDVENGCVVGGIPAQVLNMNGAVATELVRRHK